MLVNELCNEPGMSRFVKYRSTRAQLVSRSRRISRILLKRILVKGNLHGLSPRTSMNRIERLGEKHVIFA
jgi:hypothetical protein